MPSNLKLKHLNHELILKELRPTASPVTMTMLGHFAVPVRLSPLWLLDNEKFLFPLFLLTDIVFQ